MNTPHTPWICYGTAWKRDNTARLVEMALDCGFTGIDTANQPKHYNEPQVGQALKKLWEAGASRDKVFVQTKFTPVDGQDQRIPYDPKADIAEQVRQSFQKSLEHLHVDYLDSYLLHGPYHHPGLGDEDWQVWSTLESLHKSGQAKRIGVSNVNVGQLELLLAEAEVKPMVVQNRCFARTGWDWAVRELCKRENIIYQGFSLLTANPGAVGHPVTEAIAERMEVSAEQVIFAFARQVGMMPLTGTTDAIHMRQDLDALEIKLTPDEVSQIERVER